MSTPNSQTVSNVKYRYLVEEPILQYIRQVGIREQPILQELRLKTAEKLGMLSLMVSFPEQTQLLQIILKLIGAKRILDIGTFTGYSALSFALATTDTQAQIITCDVSDEYTSLGKPYWERSGVANRIQLKLQPALKSLQELKQAISQQQEIPFDFIYIDADKDNQLEYVELAYDLLRVNGLLVIDNTIWSTKVMDPNDHSPGTDVIRKMNEQLHKDERWGLAMQCIGDGATLLRKK